VFLEQPYPLGDTRAVMIEGPSREALALVEVKQQSGTLLLTTITVTDA
jgi:hypothetical protein